MRLIRLSCDCWWSLVLGSPEVGAQELTLSVAVSMKDAVEELGRGFRPSRPGVTLRYNFGSSGELQKQIEAGAPIDLFVSAAQRQMDELEQQGLIVSATRRVFARNVLTVVKPADSRLDLAKPADLLDPRVRRIVIGNPKTVPVGQYAEESLRALGLWERCAAKLVFAENVRQALDYVSARRGRRRVRLHDRCGVARGTREGGVPAGRGHVSPDRVSRRGREGLEAAGAGPGVRRAAGEPGRPGGARPTRVPAAAGRRADQPGGTWRPTERSSRGAACARLRSGRRGIGHGYTGVASIRMSPTLRLGCRSGWRCSPPR